MFSAFDNPTYLARALALGACGYILKSAATSGLLSALEAAAAGKNCWSHKEHRHARGSRVQPRLKSLVSIPLSEREKEILQQLANGLTNRAIAEVLAISGDTVKEHVQHILRKIGVSDRTQAAVWAARNGML
jgi:DNA-binding NarL/FixJ family response regulator